MKIWHVADFEICIISLCRHLFLMLLTCGKPPCTAPSPKTCLNLENLYKTLFLNLKFCWKWRCIAQTTIGCTCINQTCVNGIIHHHSGFPLNYIYLGLNVLLWFLCDSKQVLNDFFFVVGFYAEILKQQVAYLSDPYLISADLYHIHTRLA